MTNELIDYKDLNKVKEEAKHKKKQLEEQKALCEKREVTIKQQAEQLKAKHEELLAKLKSDPIAIQLEELEQRMRTHEQTVYVLDDYISTKGRESQYEPVAEDCMTKIKQLNTETIKVLAEQPVLS